MRGRDTMTADEQVAVWTMCLKGNGALTRQDRTNIAALIESLASTNEAPSIFGATCGSCGFRYGEHKGHVIPCPRCAAESTEAKLKDVEEADARTDAAEKPQAELDALKQSILDGSHPNIKSLQAQCEALREDAERYRWVRDKHEWYACYLTGRRQLTVGPEFETLDAAIDAARSRGGEHG